jgi:hypothetical protein
MQRVSTRHYFAVNFGRGSRQCQGSMQLIRVIQCVSEALQRKQGLSGRQTFNLARSILDTSTHAVKLPKSRFLLDNYESESDVDEGDECLVDALESIP